MISIELTEEDAKMYKEFCRHYRVFRFMSKKGILETKEGAVTIYFDQNGVPQKAVINKKL